MWSGRPLCGHDSRPSYTNTTPTQGTHTAPPKHPTPLTSTLLPLVSFLSLSLSLCVSRGGGAAGSFVRSMRAFYVHVARAFPLPYYLHTNHPTYVTPLTHSTNPQACHSLAIPHSTVLHSWPISHSSPPPLPLQQEP